MSTAPVAARRLQPHRERRVASLRRPLTLAAVCTVIFACAFVLGRGGGTSAAPRDGAQWSVPVVAAGRAIPASLGAAPAIDVQAPLVRVRGTGVAVVRVRTAASERLVTEAPGSAAPRRAAPVTAPAPQIHTAPPASAPSTSKPGASGGAGSRTIAHPGESFDTSG